MYRTDFWTLWEKARVGWSERIALKQVYYQEWNRSPIQVGCMRQVLRAGALGRPRGMGWRGRWERGSGWGIHVNPWLSHVNVWQKPVQYCKVISLQLIKINGKKRINICKDPSHLRDRLLFLPLKALWWESSLGWFCPHGFFPGVNFCVCSFLMRKSNWDSKTLPSLCFCRLWLFHFPWWPGLQTQTKNTAWGSTSYPLP